MHFDGLGRTKDDIIMYEIADVFKAKNLIDVSTASEYQTYCLKCQVTVFSLFPALGFTLQKWDSFSSSMMILIF